MLVLLVMMHFLWCSDVQVPLKCWLLLLLKSVVLKVVLFVVVVATELLSVCLSVCLSV